MCVDESLPLQSPAESTVDPLRPHIVDQPVEELGARSERAPVRRNPRGQRCWMLAITVPAPIEGEYGMMSHHLGAERLILVTVRDSCLEITDSVDHAPTDHQIG